MTERRRTLLIFAFLYPLGAGAAAINAFFASLIASSLGSRVLTPVEACIAGLLLGVPATYAFACHITNLIQRADGGDQGPEEEDSAVFRPAAAGLTASCGRGR